MQGTQVLFLVWDDPTCCGAIKPKYHNYWAEPTRLEPVLHNKSSSTHLLLQREKAWTQQQRPRIARKKKKVKMGTGTSLVIQGLRILNPNAGGPVSIPG